MRVLIDIGHPAHFHLFKHFAWKMEEKGHKILFTCRDKEFVIYLLKSIKILLEKLKKKYLIIGMIIYMMTCELE